MQIVSSYNEWDPLEEVIVGVSDNACFAYDEPSNIVLMSPDGAPMYTPGPRSSASINKARTQLDNLCRVLQQHCNVKILRPEKIDFTKPVQKPYFSIKSQNCAACPRDTLLVVGNEIIESTMSHRSRYFEAMAYRKLLNEIWEKDANMLWTMAPKPTMMDSMYYTDFPWNNKQERTNWIHSYRYVTNETEPVFDAADVLRLGKDLFVQHGFTTNRKGIEWLRRHTKSRGFRVHELHFPDDLMPFHIALVPPTNERKGILLSNPERPIHETEVHTLFKGSNWDSSSKFKEAVDKETRFTLYLSPVCRTFGYTFGHKVIKGITIDDTELLISQCADDASLISYGSPDSMDASLEKYKDKLICQI